MNIVLWTLTFSAVIISLIKSKSKTQEVLKLAWQKFYGMLWLFLVLMAAFALAITFMPSDLLNSLIGTESGVRGAAISVSLGSVSVMPGFAAYPLMAALKSQGIPYYIIAGFALSLMNVGIVSFPLEKKFLGVKVALIRNILGLVVSILVVIAVKLIFNE